MKAGDFITIIRGEVEVHESKELAKEYIKSKYPLEKGEEMIVAHVEYREYM